MKQPKILSGRMYATSNGGWTSSNPKTHRTVLQENSASDLLSCISFGARTPAWLPPVQLLQPSSETIINTIPDSGAQHRRILQEAVAYMQNYLWLPQTSNSEQGECSEANSLLCYTCSLRSNCCGSSWTGMGGMLGTTPSGHWRMSRLLQPRGLRGADEHLSRTATCAISASSHCHRWGIAALGSLWVRADSAVAYTLHV